MQDMERVMTDAERLAQVVSLQRKKIEGLETLLGHIHQVVTEPNRGMAGGRCHIVAEMTREYA
jgi:hypothetical protein